MAEGFHWQAAAEIFDVPPWLVRGDYPPPRFPRVWPLKRLDLPAPKATASAMEDAAAQSLEKFRDELLSAMGGDS